MCFCVLFVSSSKMETKRTVEMRSAGRARPDTVLYLQIFILNIWKKNNSLNIHRKLFQFGIKDLWKDFSFSKFTHGKVGSFCIFYQVVTYSIILALSRLFTSVLSVKFSPQFFVFSSVGSNFLINSIIIMSASRVYSLDHTVQPVSAASQ